MHRNASKHLRPGSQSEGQIPTNKWKHLRHAFAPAEYGRSWVPSSVIHSMNGQSKRWASNVYHVCFSSLISQHDSASFTANAQLEHTRNCNEIRGAQRGSYCSEDQLWHLLRVKRKQEGETNELLHQNCENFPHPFNKYISYKKRNSDVNCNFLVYSSL